MKTKIKDNVIYLDEGRLELYVPQKYVDGSVANISGNTIDTFGLMNYKFYKNVTDTKPTKIGVLNVPSMMTFYPTDIRSNIKTKIYDDSKEREYTVLVFQKGDKIMHDYITKDLSNVELFTNLLFNGNIDNNIPYDLISQAWITCMTTNDIDLAVPITVIDFVIAELYRDQNNIDKKFGVVVGKNPSTSMIAYTPIKLRTICATNSVFAALTFEDMNSMLDASLNMTIKEKEQTISPVEQIIKM